MWLAAVKAFLGPVVSSRYFWIALISIGLIWWAWHSLDAYGDRREAQGDAHGSQRVQGQWDKDKAAIASVAAKTAKENSDKEGEARRHNAELEETNNATQKSLGDAVARSDLLARRLRDAIARNPADSSAVQKNHSGPDPFQTGGYSGDAELDQAVSTAVRECWKNAIDQTFSFDSINPQLDP